MFLCTPLHFTFAFVVGRSCIHVLYGETSVVYNVHSLLHIVDDVKYSRTSLNQLSAFRFENYLQSLKSLIRSASNPLVQAAKRIEESEMTTVTQPVNAKDVQNCTGRS